MHSCIFALLGGTRVIALAYQPKHFGVFESVGMESFVYDVWDFDPDTVAQRIEWALTHEHHPSDLSEIRKNLQNQLRSSLGMNDAP